MARYSMDASRKAADGMSIWSSILGDSTELRAIPNDGDAANYRGEGADTLYVDVATTFAHDRIRLAVWSEASEPGEYLHIDVEALLSPDAATELARRLVIAARHNGKHDTG